MFEYFDFYKKLRKLLVLKISKKNFEKINTHLYFYVNFILLHINKMFI